MTKRKKTGGISRPTTPSSESDTRLDDLELKLTTLVDKVANLTDMMTEIFDRLSSPSQSFTPLSTATSPIDCSLTSALSGPLCVSAPPVLCSPLPYGHPPLSLQQFAEVAPGVKEFYPAVTLIEGMRTWAQLQEKQHIAVIEKLPETNTDLDEPPADYAFVGRLLEACQMSERDVECVWRIHSAKEGRARPLKIRFRDPRLRDRFLTRYYKCFPRDLKIHGKVIPVARRDMTRPELNPQYNLRKQVYEYNKSKGIIQYAYRDLNVVELPTPFRPFFDLPIPSLYS